MTKPGGPSCPGTQPPKFTSRQVEEAVFEEVSPSNITVGSIYNRCSYNKTRLTRDNSLVVADPVELPCSGTTRSGRAQGAGRGKQRYAGCRAQGAAGRGGAKQRWQRTHTLPTPAPASCLLLG